MKFILMLGALSIIVLFSIELGVSPPALPYAEVVSSTRYDIDGDTQDEVIEILLVQGRLYHDKILWCGMGEKSEGQFVLQVRKGVAILSHQSLNTLMGQEQLFFRTPEFQLVLDDYNGDGQIDFNLGQYSSCLGWKYQLFTIKANGSIGRLDGYDEFVCSFLNSTDTITIRDGNIGFYFYSHKFGEFYTKWYHWNGEHFAWSFTTWPYSQYP